MGYSKLTGAQAILGGVIVLESPTFLGKTSDAIANRANVGTFKRAGLYDTVIKIPFTGASFATTTITTSFDTTRDIPAGAVVTDAWFDIHTVGTSGSITAGTDLDPDGFLKGIGVQTAVPVVGKLDLPTSVTYGALFTDSISATSSLQGTKVNYVATSAKSVRIGRSATTAGVSTVVGDLYIHFMLPASS